MSSWMHNEEIVGIQFWIERILNILYAPLRQRPSLLQRNCTLLDILWCWNLRNTASCRNRSRVPLELLDGEDSVQREHPYCERCRPRHHGAQEQKTNKGPKRRTRRVENGKKRAWVDMEGLFDSGKHRWIGYGGEKLLVSPRAMLIGASPFTFPVYDYDHQN